MNSQSSLNYFSGATGCPAGSRQGRGAHRLPADPAKPVIAVLLNGRPLALQWLADSVPAILETWFLGVEHGTAMADVLFGEYNPSGRLPVSFPRVTGQVPIYYSHKPTGRPPAEDDHYTSKYIDVPWTPLWTFGHGLSYTRFKYSNLRLSADTLRAGDSVMVSVSVRNRRAPLRRRNSAAVPP